MRLQVKSGRLADVPVRHGARIAFVFALVGPWAQLAAANPGPSGEPSPEVEARARALYQEGLSHYQKRDYTRAIRAFSDAYDLLPEPTILFNIGQAYRFAGDCKSALDYYQRYQAALAGEQPVSEYQEAVRECQAAARTATVGEEAPDTGSPAATDVPGSGTEPRMVEEPRIAEESPGRAGAGFWPLATAAAGGVLLVSAIVPGVLAKRAESDLDDACPERTGCDPSLASTRDRMKRLAVITDVLWITGAAAATGGLLWWYLDRRGDHTSEEPTISLGGGPGAVGVSVRGAF